MTSEPLLSILNPIRPSSIPSEEELVATGTTFINSSSTWAAGSTYSNGNVKTSHLSKRPGDGAPWYCRYSEHTKAEITFEELWNKLSVNKAENEKKYIHELKSVIRVKQISAEGEIWALHYHFTPPVADRVFVVLQVSHLYAHEGQPRVGIIVSIPVDLSSSEDEEARALLPEGAIIGRYVSVERVMELENGNVEWRVISSSSPGGSIPNFIVNGTMAKSIARDVPSFMKWFKSLSNENS